MPRERTLDNKPTWNESGSGGWFKGLPGRIDWKATLITFAAVVAITVVVHVVLHLVITAADGRPSLYQGDGAALLIASHLATFVAYLAGGIMVRRMTRRDPVLHALALVVLGVLLSALAVAVNYALGFPIENALKGNFGENLALVQFVIGPWWTVPAVGTTAALLGSVIVPSKDEKLDEDPLHDRQKAEL